VKIYVVCVEAVVATFEANLWSFLYSKTYVIFFSRWKKKIKTEERNLVKTTSLLTLEEHFASGFTGNFFERKFMSPHCKHT
jgi:hypothetical protein